MKEFIEKLIGRLEEEKKKQQYLFNNALNNEHQRMIHEYAEQCYLYMTDIANQLAEEHKDEYYPKAYIDQVRWERDIAISQLNELGYEFGEKVGWIPCSERLPEFDQEVLLSTDDFAVYQGVMKNGGFRVWEEGWIDIKYVLAWQPLPAPYQPKGE